MTTANITYRRNPRYSESTTPHLPRLFAELDLSGYGIKKAVKGLPIYYRRLPKPVGPVRVVYTAYPSGIILETGNLYRLEQAIDDTLKALIRFERLPEYVFRVEDKAWPIYHLANEFTTRYPGGPVFSTPDIASLRLWLADHFKAIGRIQNRREMDLLYLSPEDLQLSTPYCVFRTPDEAVADIPVFLVKTQRTLQLMAPLSSQFLSVDYAAGKGIFALYTQVGNYLHRQGQLDDLFEMTIRKLSAQAWENLEPGLAPETHQLAYQRETDGKPRLVQNPIFCEAPFYIAARLNRLGRIVLYLAPDMPDLRQRVSRDLYSYGAIKDPNEVQAVMLEPA